MSFLSVPLPTALRATLHFYSSRPFQRGIYYGALRIVRNIIIDISRDVLCIRITIHLHMNQCVRERERELCYHVTLNSLAKLQRNLYHWM